MVSKKFMIFLIISAVLLIGGGIFLFIASDDSKPRNNSGYYNDYINEDRGNSSEEERGPILDEEDLKIYSQDVNTYVVYLDSLFSHKYPIKDFNKMSDEDKTMFLVKTKVNVEQREVGIAELERIKKDYFDDFELVSTDLKKDGQVIYKYDNGRFVYNGGGSLECLTVSKKVADNPYDDFWEIENMLYFVREVDKDGNTYNVIYKNMKDCKNQKDEIYTYTYDNGGFDEKGFDAIKHKLSTYVYRFERVGNQYFIKSINLKKDSK